MGVLVQAKDGSVTLTVTNAYTLAEVTVHAEGDLDLRGFRVPIPRPTLQAWEKAQATLEVDVEERRVCVNGRSGILMFDISLLDVHSCNFDDLKASPSPEESEQHDGALKSVCANPALLAKVSDALGAEAVELTFNGHRHPTLVEPLFEAAGNGRGLWMPIVKNR